MGKEELFFCSDPWRFESDIDKRMEKNLARVKYESINQNKAQKQKGTSLPVLTM